MAEIPIRKRTLAETLQHLAEHVRDARPGQPLDLAGIALSLDVAAQEAADLADAEGWKHRAALEHERAEKANEVYMRYALALEPPLPGLWHFGGAQVPHLASACTDDKCWSPIKAPDGRAGLLRLGWDVQLTMVSPRQVIRFEPRADENGGA